MLEILIHANVGKVDGVFTARVRTEEARELVAKRAAEKGLNVNIEVIRAPRYFRTKQEHLEQLLNIPEFKEFYNELGLKLTP